MKIPKRLEPLLEDGLIDGVVRQLMSGKEAMVFVVRCGGDVRCAKVYKEANQRSFRQAVDYTENRKTRNSRQARAMAKGSQGLLTLFSRLRCREKAMDARRAASARVIPCQAA
jgi:RIO kinase 1